MNWLDAFRHWLAVWTGTSNVSGDQYGFLSGAAGDLGEITLIGGMITLYRKHACHEPRCWRIGHHPVEGTPFAACRRHHPALHGKPARGHMTAAWLAARTKGGTL